MIILTMFSTHLMKEAPPTRAERLGYQPRQAAGYLGPGKVIVVEALDSWDDEGPSHPAVICRISHLYAGVATVRSFRVRQEFLLTADDIPSRGIPMQQKKSLSSPG